MIDQLADSNVAYAVGGGVVYATLFALKATQAGEPFSETKFGITLVLAASLGFGFEVAGYHPSAYDWFALLFAFSGMIATLEQAAKLAARGYYGEAREAVEDAAREGADVATGLAGGQEAARRGVEQRLPREVRPAADADEQYGRAREEFGGYSGHLETPPEDEDGDADVDGEENDVDGDRRTFLSGFGLFGDDDGDDERSAGDDDTGGSSDGNEEIVTEGP